MLFVVRFQDVNLSLVSLVTHVVPQANAYVVRYLGRQVGSIDLASDFGDCRFLAYLSYPASPIDDV